MGEGKEVSSGTGWKKIKEKRESLPGVKVESVGKEMTDGHALKESEGLGE